MLESLAQLSMEGGMEEAQRLRYTADARLLTTFNVVTVREGDLRRVGLSLIVKIVKPVVVSKSFISSQ